jgi:dTDP-4-dehydrorhamnose reductase
VARFESDHDAIQMGLSGAGERLVRVDLRDPEAFTRALQVAQPDVVIHLAAHKDPDYCEEHPGDAEALNVGPVRTLCEILPATTRIVLASTDYVFDGIAPPYKEESVRHPLSVYGKTKAAAEDLLHRRARTTVVRFPVLVGAGPTLEKSGFIWQIVGPLRTGLEVTLDDVLQRRPVWIEDVARAIRFLVDREADGVFHLSGPSGGTRYGWTVGIGGHLGLPTGHIRPSREIVARRAERPRDSHLDTSKIEAMGFGPFTPFTTVVDEVLAGFGV